MKKHTTRPERGVALVVTLSFLVIIVITIVAFLDSSLTERAAASSHFERSRSANIARLGLETAVATLQRETADSARNWISQPGALVVPAPPAGGDTTSAAAKKAIKELRTIVPLSSGAPGATNPAEQADPIFSPANLNVRTLVDQAVPTYLLLNPLGTEPPVEMKLRWIYLRQKPKVITLPDGTKQETPFDYEERPDTHDTANPIIGRFAYWVDDESAKVNYNLAWSRSVANKFPPGHQTKIDLRALPTTSGKNFTDKMADALHQAITPDAAYATVNRFFNSPYDARQLGDKAPGLQDALNYNRFNLTHLNSDPDTTYYGQPRMMLTTQLKNAVLRDKEGKPLKGTDGKWLTRPFLDILKVTDPDNYSSGSEDPGYVASVDTKDPAITGTDAGKLNTVVQKLIIDYLQRTDWPMVDGLDGSLQAKYYGTYSSPAREQRLAQLALNIIDYVRTAESALTVVEPLRGIWMGSAFVGDSANSSIAGREDTFKGLTRALHMTEMGFWISSTAETAGPNKGRYPGFAFVEVHLPENYGIDSIDLSQAGQRWKVYFTGFGNGNFKMRDGKTTTPIEPLIEFWPNLGTPPSPTSTGFIWDALTDPSKVVIKAGEYRTFAIETWSVKPRQEVGTNGSWQLRSAITLEGSGRRIDVAPLGAPSTGAAPLDYTIATSEATRTTFQFPIASVETDDPRVNGVARAWNPAAKSTFSAVNQAQLASLGKAAKSYVPEQDTDAAAHVTKASMRMPYPRGYTSNPNGRVRSPAELGLIHSGIEGSSKVSSFGVPWRSLRLQPSKLKTTAVPDWAFMDLFTVPVDVPQSAAVVFAPNNTSTGGRVNINAQPRPFALDRKDPLVAVLLGARKSTSGDATLTLPEARTIASNIYDRRRAATGKQYPAAPALDVYESPGEIAEIAGVADAGEESEELIREVANLVTARGNIFSVYTVGQALKQTPTGKLIVTGEQRHQAFVERFLDNRGTVDPADDEVRVRTDYFRNLTP